MYSAGDSTYPVLKKPGSGLDIHTCTGHALCLHNMYRAQFLGRKFIILIVDTLEFPFMGGIEGAKIFTKNILISYFIRF